MYTGKTLFAQLMDFLPWTTFERHVRRYNGNRRVRRFNCAAQFRAMVFAQLTHRESLRDIEVCLNAQGEKIYHLGFREPVRRTTLADANERRDWRIYADFANTLISQARPMYAGDSLDIGDLEAMVYALDSTTIDLCLSMFDWTPFRSTKAAIKLHTLIDLHGPIPSFLYISDGKMHDVKALDHIVYERGAYYVFDRAYVDFARLNIIHRAGAYFVTRAKRGMRFRRISAQAVDRATGIICDQVITLEGFYSQQGYPEKFRRIRFKDPETGKRLVFITNNMTLPALTICLIYKRRWKVELFFKWIKQHLRVKKFFGRSPNAVKTQIWIAICTYVLIAIARKRLKLDASLYTLLQILSISVFEKMPINKALSCEKFKYEPSLEDNQLNLQGF